VSLTAVRLKVAKVRNEYQAEDQPYSHEGPKVAQSGRNLECSEHPFPATKDRSLEVFNWQV
jgi:hypothetical protein